MPVEGMLDFQPARMRGCNATIDKNIDKKTEVIQREEGLSCPIKAAGTTLNPIR
jgi:hypothetical protein